MKPRMPRSVHKPGLNNPGRKPPLNECSVDSHQEQLFFQQSNSKKGQNSRPEFAILETAHIVNLLHEGDRAILPQPRVRNEPPLSSQMQVPASRLDA